MRPSQKCGSRALIFSVLFLLSTLISCGGGGSSNGGGGGGGGGTQTPNLVLSGAKIDFGSTAVQSTGTGSVTATNSGTGTLTISSVSLSGDQASDFVLTSPSLPVNLSAGSSATLQFSFTPKALGTRSASATVASNAASNGSQSVNLTGAGTAPQQSPQAYVTLSPNTIASGATSTAITINGASAVFVQEPASDTSFALGGTVANFGPGIALGSAAAGATSAVNVTSSTSGTVQVTVQPNAAPGPRTIVVSTAGHNSTATLFITSSAVGPVANAGTPQIATVGSTASLDGSHSFERTSTSVSQRDVTSQPNSQLSPAPPPYQWSFLSMPSNSNAKLNDANSVTPSFGVDQPGDYVLQLAFSDATSTTLSATAVSTNATVPVAHAGPNQVVKTGSTVQLDGSGSTDAQGRALSYAWNFVSTPSGSAATLSNAGSVVPTTFVADVAGDYVVQLTVNDGQGNTASDHVTISTTSVPPVANAGPNQSVTLSNTVQLDGTSSSSPGGDTLSYQWAFTYKPAGSVAALSDATNPKPTFVADAAGVYALQLVVSDTHGHGSVGTTFISTNPIAPVAVAGIPQTLISGRTVQLDGSGSTGAGSLTYQWALIGMPAGSKAALSSATIAKPTFVADQAGFYVAQLIVSDASLLKSAPSTVLITTQALPDIGFSSTNVNFGNQLVNTTANQSFTVTNTGSANLTISGIRLSGQNFSSFSFSSASLPITINPGKSTSIGVSFSPTSTGNQIATLFFDDNAASTPQSVSLAGTGVQPAINISPGTITFPNQLVNTASSVLPVTLSNPGTADLVISTITISGGNAAEFSFSPSVPTTPLTIKPNGTPVTLNLVFTPAGSGLRSATLQLTDNASGSPQSVSISGVGLSPGVQITPQSASLAFGPLRVGNTSNPLTVTITNTGNSSLTVSNISLAGTNPGDYSFSSATLPITIAATTSTTINVAFKPTAVGTRAATLQIVHNAPGSPAQVALTGTGIAPAITVTPNSKDFGSVRLNTTTPPASFTIKNTGTDVLNISKVSESGSGDFTLDASQVPATLAAGASATFSVTFKPSALGSISGSTSIASDALGIPTATVPLSGTGVQPAVQLSANSLAFGNQLINTNSAAQTVTITNTGTDTLNISGITKLGTGNPSDFTLDTSQVPASIAPNGIGTIIVTFAPTAAGSRSATVQIADDAPGSPHSFTLSGTGTQPVFGESPNPLAFGNQLVGQTSTQQAITISNTGNGNLIVSNVSVGGANAADFKLVNVTTPFTVAPGNTATVNLTFSPLFLGARSASVTFTDNATTSPQQVPLTGTGTAPAINVSPSGVDFGPVVAHQTSSTNCVNNASCSVTISNSGTADLVISSITMTGTNVGEFGFSSATVPVTVPTGQSTTVTLNFTPNGAGARSATLTINDNVPGSSQATVSLSGTGIAPAVLLSPAANSTMTFAPQNVNTTSAAQNVTVSNVNGTADLHVSGMTITGPNQTDFAVSGAVTPFTVAKGQSTIVGVTFSPSFAGSRTATLTFTDDDGGVAGTQQTINLSGTGLSQGTISMPPVTVGQNLEFLANVQLSAGAPSGGITVTVTSPDTSKVLLSADPTLQGTGSVQLSIAPGQTSSTSGFYVQGLVSSGSLQLKLSAPGWLGNSPTITMVPSAFVISGPAAGIGGDFTQPIASDVTLTVASYPLKPDGTANTSLAQNVRGGLTPSVTVTSANTNVGTISSGSPITFTGGTSAHPVTFHPVNAGNSTLVSVTEPQGFSPPSAGASLNITVKGPTISISSLVVGANMETLGVGSLDTPAPSGGLNVTISANSGILFSTDPTVAGVNPLIVNVAQGGTSLPPFYVQATGAAGGPAIQMTASANFYTSGTSQIQVTPSAVLLAGPGGQPGQAFSTTTISQQQPSQLMVAFYRLDPSNNPVQAGILRGGLSLSMSSNNILVSPNGQGTIFGSATLSGGSTSDSSSIFYLPPQSAATVTLSISQPTPAGGVPFSNPTSGGSVQVNVTAPSVSIAVQSFAGQNIVGNALQIGGSGSLSTPAPSQLYVKVSAGNGLRVANSLAAAGSSSVCISIPQNGGTASQGGFSFFVQGTASSGTGQVSAAVYQDAGCSVLQSGWTGSSNVNVSLGPSGFVLASTNGPGADASPVLAGNNPPPTVPLAVQTAVLDSAGNFVAFQALSGGLSVPVAILDTNPGIGSLTPSPLTYNGGDSFEALTFTGGLTTGSATLTLQQPNGFIRPIISSKFVDTLAVSVH